MLGYARRLRPLYFWELTKRMFGRKKENILVVKTDGLAAFVAAEPIFESIRNAHPHAQISLLTSNALQRVARASPYFDQVAAMPPQREPEARKAFVRQLKTAKFARVYDLAADEEARKLHGAMGPIRPKWFSVSPAPKRKSKGKAPQPADSLPSVEKFLSSSGLETPQRLPDFSWALSARKDSANMQPSWFGISGAFGLLLPAVNETHRWPAERYAEFGRAMARASIMPVLAGGKELHGFGDEVAHFAPEVVDLSGKTDHLQLAALAQEACFFVSDDAEEVHLAVSAGCAGVLIKKTGAEAGAPTGRHVVTLTVGADLGEASAEFVWRTLDNMTLIPGGQGAAHATAR